MAERFPSRIIERPMAPDVREWAKFIMDVLNELDVHVGERFEVRALERSTRKPILAKRDREDHALDKQAEREAIEAAPEASQDSLL